MVENFGEEMASEDASRVLERRILLTMYEALLVTPLNHVHQDLAEKASRGAMTDTDVQWGGGVPDWPSLHVEGMFLHVWEVCQLIHPLQLILPDSLR